MGLKFDLACSLSAANSRGVAWLEASMAGFDHIAEDAGQEGAIAEVSQYRLQPTGLSSFSVDNGRGHNLAPYPILCLYP